MGLIKKISLALFVFFAFAGVSYAETLPTDWFYECSEAHQANYGHPCVLKNDIGRIVFTSLSAAVEGSDQLPASMKYHRTYGGTCSLVYVRPLPIGAQPPKSYIVQEKWLMVRGLGDVEDVLCQ